MHNWISYAFWIRQKMLLATTAFFVGSKKHMICMQGFYFFWLVFRLFVISKSKSIISYIQCCADVIRELVMVRERLLVLSDSRISKDDVCAAIEHLCVEWRFNCHVFFCFFAFLYFFCFSFCFSLCLYLFCTSCTMLIVIICFLDPTKNGVGNNSIFCHKLEMPDKCLQDIMAYFSRMNNLN